MGIALGYIPSEDSPSLCISIKIGYTIPIECILLPLMLWLQTLILLICPPGLPSPSNPAPSTREGAKEPMTDFQNQRTKYVPYPDTFPLLLMLLLQYLILLICPTGRPSNRNGMEQLLRSVSWPILGVGWLKRQNSNWHDPPSPSGGILCRSLIRYWYQVSYTFHFYRSLLNSVVLFRTV